ncbi:imidazole glycerol phosphate synthase subunit HisH [Patescibacteria group bacterium]
MITIIDYNSGNLASVQNALKKLGFKSEISNDPKKISKASRIIFPGVGRASFAMEQLNKMQLDQIIKNSKVPFLGICLGLQLLADNSEEDKSNCLSIIPGNVKRFSNILPVPQIGWNKISIQQESSLFQDIPDQSYFYFVNSYFYQGRSEYILSTTSYGNEFASAIQKENFYATQFHPEKSGTIGLQLLNNFCKLC